MCDQDYPGYALGLEDGDDGTGEEVAGVVTRLPLLLSGRGPSGLRG